MNRNVKSTLQRLEPNRHIIDTIVQSECF